MKNIIACFVAFIATHLVCFSQSVALDYPNTSARAVYAAGKLEKALLEKGYVLNSSKPTFTISLNASSVQLGAEAYSIVVQGEKITVSGGDERGMIYGSLSIVEDLRKGIVLKNIKPITEKPHFELRAIKFDLPWDTYRHSISLDQHSDICKDIKYWEAFLDMMVENRFNALSVWNLHPFTFMIRAKNFPKATPFTDAELKVWQDLFHGIFRLAQDRSIDTYLIPFNIFVTPEFEANYSPDSKFKNPNHDFFVDGDSSELVKRYTRESVAQVLQEYPELTGLGLTLGEGMGGMEPAEREQWMNDTYLEGMRLAGRKSKLVHRIPFSSTTGSLGVTSVETEKLTRKVIEEQGAFPFIDGPIWADLKYNWSHAYSTPQLIKVHGGKLYDTYFKPVSAEYKVTWTARNEDFFALRWGVPEFIRAHIANNSNPYNGGYFVGSETYIPAKDYFTKIDGPVNWKYAFERQWLFYKLWGRLLYNPATSDQLFHDEFLRRYGKQGRRLLEASSLAGKTPLRLASSFDFTNDLTFYSEGMMARNTRSRSLEYISVSMQINQRVTDSNYVAINEYVQKVLDGSTFDKRMVTPPMVALMLEEDCKKALELVKNIDTAGDNALMYEVSDIKIWANLGLSFAEKLRGAVALQTYLVKGGDANKAAAVRSLENTLSYWDKVIQISSPLYKEMPLVHYTEQRGVRAKENDNLRFHWENLRPAVAKDIEVAKDAVFVSK